jgi:large subunit ribosomal protein L5
MQPELKTQYLEKVVPSLREKGNFPNPHQVPGIEKVVVQCHVGRAADRKQAVADAMEEIARITGQQPIMLYAKRSVSNFKVREGEAVGAKVTLRGPVMWEFLQRLLFTAIPTIRDFRGVSSKAFDGRGNYTLGISEQSIFPEVELDKIKRNLGFDVNIVTSATNDDDALLLLTELGMPFRKPVVKEAEATSIA